jgi:hypothetical protein
VNPPKLDEYQSDEDGDDDDEDTKPLTREELKSRTLAKLQVAQFFIPQNLTQLNPKLSQLTGTEERRCGEDQIDTTEQEGEYFKCREEVIPFWAHFEKSFMCIPTNRFASMSSWEWSEWGRGGRRRRQ